MRELGKRIYERRTELGLSRKEFGKLVKLKRMQIYRIEKGDSPTKIKVLFRMAKVFKISVSELIDV